MGIVRLGGTWGDQINMIISNDYALGKGSSGPSMGPAVSLHAQPQQPPSQQHASGSIPISIQSPKKEDPQVYRSWKLRRALQRENELQKENHPDERHIIRVAQHEERDRPSSRPMSHPASVHDSNENG